MVTLKETTGDRVGMLEHVLFLRYAREHTVAFVAKFSLLVVFLTRAVDPVVANPHAQAEVLVTGEFRGGHGAEGVDVLGGKHCVQDLEGLASGGRDGVFIHDSKVYLATKVGPLLSVTVS